MIQVSRLNNDAYFLNSDMIEQIEETPNTILTLTSGKRLVVLESATEVIDRIVAFRKSLYTELPKITIPD